MCYRRVTTISYVCGHVVPVSASTVDCGLTNCRYSANHPAPSTHNCVSTCSQWYG
ncbi:hypothetical protein K488DRAFT_39852 [Vararia minispora EC-137]|uniref:Uncharacterized protein n=1 Tax=Vararia minispora EC-137 TaxID=1314806 RepID=A0ACB8R064_9AGAM|nr:hypothetical protein K488DRAFT_39852 [Vararia minispora EC-137]